MLRVVCVFLNEVYFQGTATTPTSSTTVVKDDVSAMYVFKSLKCPDLLKGAVFFICSNSSDDEGPPLLEPVSAPSGDLMNREVGTAVVPKVVNRDHVTSLYYIHFQEQSKEDSEEARIRREEDALIEKHKDEIEKDQRKERKEKKQREFEYNLVGSFSWKSSFSLSKFFRTNKTGRFTMPPGSMTILSGMLSTLR